MRKHFPRPKWVVIKDQLISELLLDVLNFLKKTKEII
jgi:hypothetical protein